MTMASSPLRFTTYDLFDLFGSDSAEARGHYEMVVHLLVTVEYQPAAVEHRPMSLPYEDLMGRMSAFWC
ncbi:MAG: hypothetical protein ACRDPY_33760 [Streptosporangiaceae bacterium]